MSSSVERDDKALIMLVTIQKAAQVIVHLSLIAVERLFLYDLDAFSGAKHASQFQYYRKCTWILTNKPENDFFFAIAKYRNRRMKTEREDGRRASAVKRRNDALWICNCNLHLNGPIKHNKLLLVERSSIDSDFIALNRLFGLRHRNSFHESSKACDEVSQAYTQSPSICLIVRNKISLDLELLLSADSGRYKTSLDKSARSQTHSRLFPPRDDSSTRSFKDDERCKRSSICGREFFK